MAAIERYYDAAENDYLYLKASMDNGMVFNSMCAISQNQAAPLSPRLPTFCLPFNQPYMRSPDNLLNPLIQRKNLFFSIKTKFIRPIA